MSRLEGGDLPEFFFGHRPLNTVATDRVIRVKRASPDYQALRKFFGAS